MEKNPLYVSDNMVIYQLCSTPPKSVNFQTDSGPFRVRQTAITWSSLTVNFHGHSVVTRFTVRSLPGSLRTQTNVKCVSPGQLTFCWSWRGTGGQPSHLFFLPTQSDSSESFCPSFWWDRLVQSVRVRVGGVYVWHSWRWVFKQRGQHVHVDFSRAQVASQ